MHLSRARYKASPETRRAFQRRGIPVEMLDVLETLLHVDPARRPKVSRLLKTWRSIQVGVLKGYYLRIR